VPIARRFPRRPQRTGAAPAPHRNRLCSHDWTARVPSPDSLLQRRLWLLTSTRACTYRNGLQLLKPRRRPASSPSRLLRKFAESHASAQLLMQTPHQHQCREAQLLRQLLSLTAKHVTLCAAGRRLPPRTQGLRQQRMPWKKARQADRPRAPACRTFREEMVVSPTQAGTGRARLLDSIAATRARPFLNNQGKWLHRFTIVLVDL